MPPKNEHNTSSSANEQESGDGHRRRQARESDASHRAPSPSMATETVAAINPIAYQMPNRVRLPPILPSPTASAPPRSLSVSASMSPQAHEQGARIFPSSPYATPSIRPAPLSYFPPHDRSQPTHLSPQSPAGSNVVNRGPQPEPSIPRIRAYDEFVESPYR